MRDLVFTLFPTLPVEIRLMIWSFTPILPRIVEIKSYGGEDQRSLCPLPSVLKACKESRKEILKRYAGVECGKQTVLVNSSIDTLFISIAPDDEDDYSGLADSNLRYLAIDGYWLEDAMDNNDIGYLRSLAKLCTVETITVVLGTKLDDPHTGDEELVPPETSQENEEKEDVWDRIIGFIGTGRKEISGWKPAVDCAVVRRKKM